LFITGINPFHESSDSEHDENTHEWTMVQHKRHGKKYGTSKERSSCRDVSAAIDPVIIEAEKSLTTAQKKTIALWQKKVNLNPIEESVPHEEGHSGPEGKGIDPRNWGNVQLSETEANIEVNKQPSTRFITRRSRLSVNCHLISWSLLPRLNSMNIVLHIHVVLLRLQ